MASRKADRKPEVPRHAPPASEQARVRHGFRLADAPSRCPFSFSSVVLPCHAHADTPNRVGSGIHTELKIADLARRVAMNLTTRRISRSNCRSLLLWGRRNSLPFLERVWVGPHASLQPPSRSDSRISDSHEWAARAPARALGRDRVC